MRRPKLRRIRANGIEIACDVLGSGPPLVLAHGFACGRRMWRDSASLLRERFTVITYDLRGHGESDAPEDPKAYSEDMFVQDLAAVLDGLSLERAYVGGVSMGGGIALRMALAYPARILGLIVTGVGSGSDDVEKARSNAQALAQAACAGGTSALANIMIETGWFRDYVGLGPDERQFTLELLTTHPVHGLVNTLRGVMERRRPVYDYREAFRKFDRPILPILGEYDTVCDDPMRFIAAQTGAELIVVSHSGHLVPMEQPREFVRHVIAFAEALKESG